MTDATPDHVRLAHLLSQLAQHTFEIHTAAGDDGLFTLRFASRGALDGLALAPVDGRPSTYRLDDLERAIHPGDRDRVRALFGDAGGDGTPRRTQCRVTLSGTGERWIDLRAEPEASADGGTCWRGSIADVTVLKDVVEQFDTQHERLTMAAQVGGIGIWEVRMPSLEFVYNETMHEIYGIEPDRGFRAGVPPGTFAGSGPEEWLNVVHPDDVPDVTAALERANRDLTTVEYEHRIFRTSGEMRYVRSAVRVMVDGHGAPARAIGTTQDVTEHRRLTTALGKEKERLVLAARAGRIGIWEIDFTDQRFIWDDQMHALYGLPQGSFSGRIEDWVPLLHPDDLPDVMRRWEAAVGGGGAFDTEFRARRPSGEIVSIHAIARVIAAADGRALRALGINWDVTTERTLTEALRVEKERLALATRVSGVGIWELDLARMEVIWDERMDEIFAGAAPHFRTSVPPNTYGGTFDAYLESLHPDDVWIVLRETERVKAGADTIECEFRIRGGGGTWRHIRAFARTTRDAEGRPRRLVGTNTDITAERAVLMAIQVAKETAERAERTKSEFLAMMSHEIRTPMNTVLGMTRLTLQTDLSPRQRNYLTKIDVSARNLIAILNDVLDFSKIEAGKMALEETAFTLESVLEAVAAVTAIKAEEKGLEIAFSVAPGVPTHLVGDPLRVGQVLINLTNNAVKFTERGEVVVEIGIDTDRPADRPVVPGRAALRIAVRDTGIGLDRDQIADLFQAFSQAERSISRTYGGTGLGLAISKQLVELMGGRIRAEGEPGRGSTFTFTLDLALASDAPARSAHEGLPGLAGRRVLIVDDNASAREILVLMVARFGMHATAVASGPAALAVLQDAWTAHAPFELVLMDWRMPGMDGLEVARLIKIDPTLHGTPAVLMVTAYGREEILKRAQQLHLEGVLIKPVTESVLFNTIADALGCVHAGTAERRGLPTERTRDLPGPLPGVAGLAGRRVLIVDDNALNREVATEWLLAAGMHVDAAIHGREALACVQETAYDVVLMDIHMPEMDGLTAARAIRAQPHLDRLPIVALTAQAQTIDREASFAAGMNAHLTKPIDEMRLYATLAQLLAAAASTPAPATPAAASPKTRGAAPAVGATPAGRRSYPNTGGGADAAETSDADDDDLPASLPGVDLAASLEVLGGRRALLRRLLRSFARDFAEAPAQLAADQAAGRREEIARVAHTVKSAAAYLGVHDLSEAAALLEEAAHRGTEEAMAERVLVFSSYLDAVLRGIAALSAREPGAPKAAPAAIDAPAMLAAIAAAEPLVARGDYAAAASLDELARLASGTPLAPLADAIRNQFEEIELDEAVAGLQRLRAALAGEEPRP